MLQHGPLQRPNTISRDEITNYDREQRRNYIMKESNFRFLASMTPEDLVDEYRRISNQIVSDLSSFKSEDLPDYLSILSAMASLHVEIPMQPIHVAWGLLDSDVSSQALKFIIDAIRCDKSLGFRMTGADIFRIDSFVSNFGSPFSFCSPFWDLLIEMITSSTNCCDALLCYGLMESISTSMLSKSCSVEHLRRIWFTMSKLAESMTPDHDFVKMIVEFVHDAFTTFLSQIQSTDVLFDEECLVHITDCLSTLVKKEFFANGTDRGHLEDLISDIFQVLNSSYGSHVQLAIAHLLSETLDLVPPIHHRINVFVLRLLQEMNRTLDHENREAMLSLMTKCLKAHPKSVSLFRQESLFAIPNDALISGTLPEKTEAAKFFAILADSAFLSDEKENFVAFGLIEEMATILPSITSEKDKVSVIQGLCRITGFIERNKLPKEYPLMKPFYDPRVLGLFQDSCYRSSDEVSAHLQELLRILRAIDPMYCL